MRALSWFGLLATAGVALTAQAAKANDEPGAYVVNGCAAEGRPAPLDGWTSSFSDAADSPAVNWCADGGPFGFDTGEVIEAFRPTGQWTFTAPPGTTVVGVAFDGLRGSGGGQYRSSLRTENLNASIPGFDEDSGPQRLSVPLQPPGSRYVTVGFGCETSSCDVPGSAYISTAALTLRDPVAPAAEIVTQPPELRFTDEGGGVERIDLEIDGAPRSLLVGGERCRRPFVMTVPCALSGEVNLAVPRLDAGDHTVAATVIDAAGNRTAVGPSIVHVEAPAIQAPSPPVAVGGRPGRVRVEGSATRRTRFARQITIKGAVVDTTGGPLERAAVGVSSRTAAGVPAGESSVVTDAKGRFAFKLPRGPSRTIRFSYGDSVQTVTVIVPAPVRLRTDHKSVRNGNRVAFLGRVPGAGTARTRVELQARADGKWIPFRTVALRNGRFRATYRFTRTFVTQRYRFRAVIHKDPDFPYAAGRSRVVKVLVRA